MPVWIHEVSRTMNQNKTVPATEKLYIAIGDVSQLDDLLRDLFALWQLAKCVKFLLYAFFSYQHRGQLDDLIRFRIEPGRLCIEKYNFSKPTE